MNPFEPGNNSNSGPYDASDAYRSPPSSSNNHQQHPRPNGSGQRSSPPQGPPPPFSSAAGSYSDGRGGSFSQYAQHPGSSMGQQQQQPQRPQQPPQRQSNPGVSFQMPDRITPQRSALSTDSVQKSDPFGGKNRSNDVNSGLPELRKDFANHLDPEGQQHGGFSGSDFKRKKSLVRPDRERMDPNHRQWYYRNHAAQLESADAAGRPAHHVGFMPSTTGHMPQHGAALPGYGVNHLQGPGGGVSGLGMISADVGQQQQRATNLPPGGLGRAAPLRRGKSILGREEDQVESGINFLKRGVSLRRSKSQPRKSELPRDWAQPEKPSRMSGIAPGPVGPWMIYCYILTICCPGPCLGLFGIKTPEQQRAWREKMGLISIILTAMGAVGFITFGFTQAVCDTTTTRYEAGKIDNGSMIFHGYDFDFNTWVHPQVGPFVAGGAWSALNPVYSDPFSSGKTDGSMMMQRGGGACSGLLKNADGTDATQFYPCQITYPTGGVRYRNSTMCHATTVADAMLDRTSSVPLQGPIYYSWDQITNTSANYLVWKGSVIDLNRLTSIYANITVPAIFSSLKTRNESWAGKDVTATVFRAQMDTTFDCLDRIARVGFVDSDSIGCVASKVELYVALVFILGVVGIKFFMAVIFGWFLSHRLGNFDNESRKQRQKRANEIEEWSDNIYRPAPAAYRPNARKSRMFLPNTSRFSTAAVLSKNIPRGAFSEKSGSASGTRSPANRLTKIGLSSPSGGSPPGSPSLQGARSSASLVNSGTNGERSMSTYGALTANAGSRRSSISHDPQFGAMGSCPFPLDHVIPQPPSDYQPFHFPLVQSICLVTAYSESFEGLRTTLDSLATTDYPNSHKVILVIADGIVKGAGSDLSTPDICLSMMKDFITPPEEIEGHSYVAIADGHKRHNMAKVYAGFYEYDDETVERSKQQRIPMVLVAKCGSPLEADGAKPGNRGKRDSQVLLMAFLQKVMFDERMTVFEYEFFNSLWRVTGVSPDHYEIILMVDADTKVFPDSLTRMVACMVEDPDIMGLCGETKIANKSETWVTMIQVFEYYISHHQTKAFEACFGGVTCLPGCFSAYRIKAPKGGAGYWVPILANPDIVEHYSENVVDTLHKKNLLLLGEDRFLTTLMLKTFPKRKMMFVPAAVCKTIVPDTFRILLSQRRRWINSTVHNLSELVMVNDLCGTFCFSMRFVIFMELAGTLVLPAAIAFTLYVVVSAIVNAIENKPVEPLPLILLALILGLPGVLIIVTSRKIAYVGWMGIYLVSLPIWNFIFPVYAFWHMDDFSWGATRIIQGDVKGDHGDPDGKFDPSNITMKRWIEFERERKLAAGLQSRDSTYDVLHIGSPDRMGSRHSMVSGSVAGHSDAPSHLQTDRLLSSLGSHMEASESSHGMRGANPGARARMDAVPLLSLPAPLGDASAAKAVGGPNAAGSIQVARPMREASPSSYSGSRAPYDPFPVEEEKQPMMRGDTTSVASSPDPIFANRSHFGSNGAEFANTLSSEPDEFGMSSHGGHVPALPPSIMGGANAARPPREVGAPRQSMSSQTGSVGMMPPRPQHSMQSHQSGPPPSSSSHASHGRGVSLVDDGPVAGSAGPRVVQRGARRQSSIQDGGSSQQQQNNGARFSRSQQDHAASTNGGHSSNATHASTNPFNRQ